MIILVTFENIPLIIGVVGHRDIDPDCIDSARERFITILREYRSKFPKTPILLLTSLASGVDLLAAKAALEVEGVSIGTLLPFEIEEYRATFENPTDLDSFDMLASLSVFIFNTTNRKKENNLKIDQMYRNNTRFLANHSDVLIAFWDGNITNLVGGTADTVLYKLRKQHRPNSLEDVLVNQREFGSVVVIPIDRINSFATTCGGPAYGLEEGTAKEIPVTISQDKIAVKKDFWNSLPIPLNSELSNSQNSHCDNLRYRAVKSSDKLRTKFRRSILIILGSGFFFIASIELQAQTESKSIAAISLVVVAASLIIFQLSRKRRVKEKYQQLSAITEASRIQEFWNSAGVKLEASDFFLLGTDHKNDWMRSLIRTVNFLDQVFELNEKRETVFSTSQISDWISREISQLSGRSGSIVKNSKILRVIRIATSIFIGISAAIWLLVTTNLILNPEDTLTLRGIFQAGFVISLSLAATLSSYSYLLALREQVFRDTRALRVLESSLETSQMDIENLNKQTQHIKISESLGLYFLRDISEWYVRYADREARTLL